MKNFPTISRFLVSICLLASSAVILMAQGSYRAQVRGVVEDASGAVVQGAKVTITDVGMNIASSSRTNDKGEYFFTGLRPANYSLKVEAEGFRPEEKRDVVLAVDQQATLNFTLSPGAITAAVEVNTSAPLLDTGNSTLGTEVTNQYIKEIPLPGRNFFGLAFLSGGVTEAAGSGTNDNYPSGTNFVSNGSRNSTADVLMDGATITNYEPNGGVTQVTYTPSPEAVEEFRVAQSNFSAEY